MVTVFQRKKNIHSHKILVHTAQIDSVFCFFLKLIFPIGFIVKNYLGFDHNILFLVGIECFPKNEMFT